MRRVRGTERGENEHREGGEKIERPEREERMEK